MTKEKDKKTMVSFTFRLFPETRKALEDKAGTIPISVVLRRLIEKYLKGEISLD